MKRIVWYLRKIESIGNQQSKKWATMMGYPWTTKKWGEYKGIHEIYEERGRKITEKYKPMILERVKRLSSLKTLRGYRHRMGYPVRGQRTKTNGVTATKLRWQKIE